MTNKFCRYLSNGYYFGFQNNTIQVKPCCQFQQSLPLTKDIEQKRQVTFNAIQNWTANCVACKIAEDAGQQSYRQSGPHWIPDDAPSNSPVTLEINLDYLCNAACVTCNEKLSSLWKIERNKLNNKKFKVQKLEELIAQTIDTLINTINFENVTFIKFFGGEPLFTNTHLKVLDKITCPEKITLHYTTNASIYPNDKTLELWKKFKCVIFSASLDGTDQQFDYIRWPLSWNKVSQNLVKLKNNKDIWNLLFRVEFTANFLNCFYYDNLERWVMSNFSHNNGGDKVEINVHACTGIWDLQRMPNGIKKMVLDKYPETHVIHKMTSNLPEPMPIAPWVEFVKIWDNRRNISWQQTFPELANVMLENL
jgi:hypothetical protein